MMRALLSASALAGAWAGKAGIAAHLVNGDGNAEAVAGSGISWNYNWAMDGAAWQDGLDYYPQIWGRDSMNNLENMPETWIWLGFNEPNLDHDGGSGMSVEEVVGYWSDIENAANEKGVQVLVGPSVANVDPVGWYSNFFSQCPDCRVDAIGFHAYSCDLGNMQNLVSSLQQFDRPLYLTEFACADNDDGNKGWELRCQYMQEVIPYLEGEDSISGYSWFSFNDDGYVGESNLVDGGQFTDLGNCYLDLLWDLAAKKNSTGKIDLVV